MKTLFLIPLVALLAGCNTTTFVQTSKDGSSLSVANHRFLWTSDSFTASFNTNGASLTANKSSADSAAIAAIAQGVAQGLGTAAGVAVKTP